MSDSLENNRSPRHKNRLLSSVFNRRMAVNVVAIGLLVDQAGYAGEFGGKLLRSNDVTRPAAPYYEGGGQVMHFGWQSTVELATDLNAIVQHYGHS